MVFLHSSTGVMVPIPPLSLSSFSSLPLALFLQDDRVLDLVTWTALDYCPKPSALKHCGRSDQITSISFICLTLANTVSGSATGHHLVGLAVKASA